MSGSPSGPGRDLAFLFTTADGKKRPCKLSGVSSHADLEAKLREKLADAALTIDGCEIWMDDYDVWVELADVELSDIPTSKGKIRVKAKPEVSKPEFISSMEHGGARAFWADYSPAAPSIPWTQFVDFFTFEFMKGQPDMTAAQQHNLKVAIDGDGDGTITSPEFDLWARANDLGESWTPPTVTPPQGPPPVVAESPLANDAGWVEVDDHTLQHVRHPNVWSSGDCSSLPVSKTGAAVRKQVPVLVENLIARREGRPPTASYDGYASCPLVTGRGKVVLAEFGYGGQIMESFPFDQAEERYSMYALKAYGLPNLYWHGMLRGRV